jgi:hypothetical protein
MFKGLVSLPARAWSNMKVRALAVSLAVFGAMVAGPASAMATESETTKKVGEVASKVGTEGVEIVLVILTALVALIVAIIIIPKAIGLIKRFI